MRRLLKGEVLRCDWPTCERPATYEIQGWPPGGWLPTWVARRLARWHRSCSNPSHMAVADAAAMRARNR